tara:strand:+ start:2628 stop:2915 length:288 start_codon:yes stop_codon:yes gene_type:complete
MSVNNILIEVECPSGTASLIKPSHSHAFSFSNGQLVQPDRWREDDREARVGLKVAARLDPKTANDNAVHTEDGIGFFEGTINSSTPVRVDVRSTK